MTLLLWRGPHGWWAAVLDARGLLHRLVLPRRTARAARRGVEKTPIARLVRGRRAAAHPLARALDRCLAGGPVPAWPIAPARTPFEARVRRALLRIPPGRTATYAEVARAAAARRGARAVGRACASNPVPLLVPCHRVVAAAGLGGFSAGLRWKRLLLLRENEAT